MILPDRVWTRAATGRSAAEIGPDPGGPPIRHVILTRFDLRILRRHRELDVAANHDRWLQHRIEEWRRICLPSVVRQQRTPDHWLLGLDGTSRGRTTDVLTAAEPYPWIRPAWQGEGDSPTRTFARALEEVVEPDAWVATTRLDNDDALALDYLSRVESYAHRVIAQQPELDDFWVAFGLGAQLVKGTCRLYPYSDPPFLTRFRRGGKPTETVNSIKHTALYEQPQPVFVVWTRHPMWLQNIHDENLVNQAKNQQLQLTPTADALALFGQQTPTTWRDRLPPRVRTAARRIRKRLS